MESEQPVSEESEAAPEDFTLIGIFDGIETDPILRLITKLRFIGLSAEKFKHAFSDIEGHIPVLPEIRDDES